MREKGSKIGSGVLANPLKSHREGAIIDDGFISSKKDKRLIKHSAFVGRIEKAHKKPLKRRRPSKKLVTTLESLADALPDAADSETILDNAKIKHKSMKSRPGAMKKREKLEKMERERFGKNMAQLTAGTPAAKATEGQQSATASRWAALRGFISQTMEVQPEFVKQ